MKIYNLPCFVIICFQGGEEPVILLYVPGILGHYGYTIDRMLDFLACGMGGIYGIVTNVYATFIFPFIVFATFLETAGAGKAINEISLALAGGTRGGPARRDRS